MLSEQLINVKLVFTICVLTIKTENCPAAHGITTQEANVICDAVLTLIPTRKMIVYMGDTVIKHISLKVMRKNKFEKC
jgi:hypothetical protein